MVLDADFFISFISVVLIVVLTCVTIVVVAQRLRDTPDIPPDQKLESQPSPHREQ